MNKYAFAPAPGPSMELSCDNQKYNVLSCVYPRPAWELHCNTELFSVLVQGLGGGLAPSRASLAVGGKNEL